MDACINTNAAEFRALQKSSGLPDFLLKSAIRAFQQDHENKWPHLDEIPKANSEEDLRKTLNIRKDGAAKINDILAATNTQSIEEAIIQVNNKNRDLNVDILPLHEDAIVTIERRPSPFELNRGESRDLNYVNSQVFIGQALENLATKFGIQTIYKTTKELENEGILAKVPEGVYVSAFILDGNIIVNADVASVDAPVHELMHVLMGSIKYTQPDLYYNLVQTAQQLSSYQDRALLYSNRSQSDIDEEVFVEEYAKFLSGMDSEFKNLDPEVIYQLNYEMSRTLDTILNGDNSVRVVPQAIRFGTTLKNLGKIVNSKNMESRYKGYADSAFMARVLANIKEDLFKNKHLEEIC